MLHKFDEYIAHKNVAKARLHRKIILQHKRAKITMNTYLHTIASETNHLPNISHFP